ncbi:MAG TPA: tRNA pseudouridine(55) synthase TruB [Candidatus Eisenbacteria bacterium]
MDKPEGWTSHDAVARLRTILGTQRVGHAGTLDPFASGLLLVGEDRATSLLACLTLLPKRYLARLKLGVATDTHDWTGKTTSTAGVIPGPDAIDAAIERLRGPIHQRPPLFSAVKVRGERLYKAARRGEEVDRDPRPVHVYEILRTGEALPEDEIGLDVTVSRGTYVRALAHDLGEALGCGAHLTALRRVSIGAFRVESALSPDKETGLDAAAFRARAIPPERAVSFLPRVKLLPGEAERLRHGVAPVLTEERIEAPDGATPLPPGEPGWPLALLDPAGPLLAVARPWESQRAGERAALLRVVAAA